MTTLEEHYEGGGATQDGDLFPGVPTSVCNFFTSKGASGGAPGEVAFSKNAAAFGNFGQRLTSDGSGFAYLQYLQAAGNTANGYWNFFWRCNDPAPASAHLFLVTLSGSTQRFQIVLASSGKLSIRSPATVRATGTINYGDDIWCRIEVSAVGTSCTLNVYKGANLLGATPDETIGGAGIISVGTGWDRWRLGQTASAINGHADFSDIVYSDTALQPYRLHPLGEGGRGFGLAR